MAALELTLIAVAITCLAAAMWQARRADALLVDLLNREGANHTARTELVQVFLDEQRRQEQRHEGERLQWRDERAELLNAALSMAANQPALIAPAWGDGPPEKLYHTEEDEIREARHRVAAEIDQMLQAHPPMLPDMGSAA